MKLLLEADCPEPRVDKDRLVVSGDGTNWDLTVSTNVWVDPVTRTAFLRPLPLADDWTTNTGGSYARLVKADYTLITASNWRDWPRAVAGDNYLVALAASDELVRTTATYAKNRAFYLSFFCAGTGDEKDKVLECGWGEPGAAGTVSLRIRGSGDVEVWKGTTFLATYDLNHAAPFATGWRLSGKSAALANRYVSLLLIPCRRRELLVTGNMGAGFSHVFEDLDPDLTTNTITAASYFWWKVPAGRAIVQCCPLKYAASGTLLTRPVTLPYAPAIGRVASNLETYDLPGYGTSAAAYTIADGASPYADFVPDGVKVAARGKYALTGDGDASAQVYAGDGWFPRTTTTTANLPYDLTQEIGPGLRLSVGDDGRAGVSFALQKVAETTLPQATVTGERPFRLAVQSDDGLISVDVVRGTWERPSAPVTHAGIGPYAYTGHDRAREFEKYRFRSTVPFDGIALANVFEDLAGMPGYAAGDMAVTADTFELPMTPGCSQGEWRLLPELGESVQDWIDRLHRDWAATWSHGWRPTATGYKWWMKRPDDLPATPALEVFHSRAEALLYGITAAWAGERVLYSREARQVNGEANEILVVGQDPRSRAYLTAQYDDAASQAPGTAPAARPQNWQGRLDLYVLSDPAFATQAAADRAKDILSTRLVDAREEETWEAPWLVRATDLVPLWRGDLVRLWTAVTGAGTGTWADFRVKSLEATIQTLQGAAGAVPRRINASRARYEVELEAEGTEA